MTWTCVLSMIGYAIVYMVVACAIVLFVTAIVGDALRARDARKGVERDDYEK